LDEQTILASDGSFGTVTVCPGGVVHIHMPHFSLKFLPDDFVRFCDLIAKARQQFDPPRRADGKPHLSVVTSDCKIDPTPDQE